MCDSHRRAGEGDASYSRSQQNLARVILVPGRGWALGWATTTSGPWWPRRRRRRRGLGGLRRCAVVRPDEHTTTAAVLCSSSWGTPRGARGASHCLCALGHVNQWPMVAALWTRNGTARDGGLQEGATRGSRPGRGDGTTAVAVAAVVLVAPVHGVSALVPWSACETEGRPSCNARLCCGTGDGLPSRRTLPLEGLACRRREAGSGSFVQPAGLPSGETSRTWYWWHGVGAAQGRPGPLHCTGGPGWNASCLSNALTSSAAKGLHTHNQNREKEMGKKQSS